ncbi:MAG: hypothetical protein RI956_614 [Pseudomonadota bacterium]|jgi:hypothetical protein
MIKTEFSDEYVKQNWRELLSIGLSQYDENYYKSEAYRDTKGAYLMEKDNHSFSQQGVS